MNKEKLIKLASPNECTACGACINICPLNCISFKLDEVECFQPVIDQKKCIGCGKCVKVCHLFKENLPLKRSEKVFVSWSRDEIIRKTSASGGIATELYKWGLENQYHCFGVEYSIEEGAFYKEISNFKQLNKIQNSKYVFSDTKDIYKKIKKYLKQKQKVLFIGLPCQVAGLFSFLGEKNSNLVTVDIICHGVCPNEYLKQHIQNIENKIKNKIDEISFRDSKFGTKNYRFTCKCKNKYFYNKGVYENDIFQIGYHKALIYRENCFNCKYATNVRIGDITISDFSGLGQLAECNYNKENVSCVILSTKIGEEIFSNLNLNNRVESYQRPAEEAYSYEGQLKRPSIPHKQRKKFISLYKKSHDFKKSAGKSLFKNILINEIIITLHIKELKKLISVIISSDIKEKIRNWRKSNECNK